MAFFRVVFFLALVMGASRLSAADFDGYRPLLGLLRVAGGTEIAVRAWTENGVGRLLLVDPATLRTRVTEGAVPEALSWDAVEKVCSGGGEGPLFFRLRSAASRTREQSANAGVRSWTPARRGVWLSFDLCPSRKPLDRWIFAELTRGRSDPLPAFISVSGLWLADHAEDFAWLAAEEKSGRLEITWVGHGETHPYDRTLPYTKTFDLTPGLDFAAEVFETEKRLLAAGQTPSVWYRFPGLISSPVLVDRLLSWGLIPLGSGAWLNKSERPRSGDVVLVHANGNEPGGLVLLKRLAKDHSGDLRAGSWSWLGFIGLLV